MKYGKIRNLSLFKKNANGTQATLSQLAVGVAPLVPIRADGTNLYVDAGVMIKAGGDLSADHAAVIQDVIDNVENGFLDLGLEPTTAFGEDGIKINGATPAQLHGYVADNLDALRTFFLAIDGLASNGLTVVVRYASEFNENNPEDNYALDPEAYKNAVSVVKEAMSGTQLKLAFSPGINEAEGDWEAQNPNAAISSYWIPDFFDVVSCTFYARPQSDTETEDAAVARSVRRLAAYLTQVSASMIGFDEFGASMTNDGAASVQRNDLALQKLLNAVNDHPDLADLTFDYSTIFLENYWGKDATLEFLVEDNAG